MRAVISCSVVAMLAVGGVLAGTPQPTDTFIIKGLPANLAQEVAAAGGTLLRTHPQIGYAVAMSTNPDFAANLEGAQGVAGVQQDLMVQWVPSAEASSLGTVRAQGSDPDPTTAFFYPCQWNMRQIDAPSAWDQGVFGDGIQVAVLDTGVDPDHQELAGKINEADSISMLTPGSSACNAVLGLPDEETYYDFRYHGTIVASLIAGNSLGMASVAPDAEIVAVKVLNCTGNGSFADVIAGILYAADLPAVQVINMSLGAYFPKNEVGGGQLLGAMSAAVNYATSKGKLVVTAAGNDGADLDKDKNYVSLPAQAGTSASIYATDILDEVAGYSNYGRSGTWVGAPGGGGPPAEPLPGCVLPQSGQGGIVGACSTYSVFISCQDNSYLYGGTGTSFASPIAAGVAALMDGNFDGALNGGQLKVGLAQTADDLGKKGVDGIYSHGRVNAGAAAAAH